MQGPLKTHEELYEEISILKQKIEQLEASGTKQNESASALWKSDYLDHAVFNLAPDPMAITDFDTGLIVDVNQAFVGWSLYSRDELIDHTTGELNFWIHNENRDSILNRLKGTGFVNGTEEQFRRRNGEVRQVIFSGKLIEIENKKWFLSVAHDITERKQAEVALKISEAKFKEIFETMEDLYYEADSQGIITLLSPSVNRLTGYNGEDLIGKSVTIAYADPHDREELLSRLLEKGCINDYELALKKRDGEERQASLSAHLVMGDNGQPVGIRGLLRDITERKQAEKEREKLILELREALSQVKTLNGLLPICASCKKIRNDEGYWEQIELYIRNRSEAQFSHGICPDCAARLYPTIYKKKMNPA